MMEHGASESIEEQSLMELTIKTKVKTVAYIDHDTDLNQLKQEPGLVQYVKIEPTFLVKKEILDDSIQAVPHTDGNEPQRVQGASTSGSTASVNEPCSTSLGNLLNVKHELDDMYIGPTMLQHMDIHYIINKNTSAVAEENSIVDDYNEAIPGNEAKKESVEDESRDKKASCKYYRKTKTEGDYSKAHLKSCFDQQKSSSRQPTK